MINRGGFPEETFWTEVESRTQGSRPRTQKNPRPRLRPRTTLQRRDSLKAKDRNARGQGHRRKCSPNKKKIFRRFPKKRSLKIFLLVLGQGLLCSSRSKGFYVQAYADDLAVLVTGADMLWIRGMARNWASEQELQLCSKKTEIHCSLTNGMQIRVPCQKMVQNLNFPRKQGCSVLLWTAS